MWCVECGVVCGVVNVVCVYVVCGVWCVCMWCVECVWSGVWSGECGVCVCVGERDV